jgi:hypothetical protein
VQALAQKPGAISAGATTGHHPWLPDEDREEPPSRCMSVLCRRDQRWMISETKIAT